MEILSKSSAETKELAARIAKKLKGGDVLALYGELGAGKTTFTQGLVAELSTDKVSSPTFIMIRHYAGREPIKQINHVDLYRVEALDGVLNLGLSELLTDEDAITIIEWPEVFESKLPPETIKIMFEVVSEDERKITCSKSF